ncbi:hypothetical protein [Serinicoccus hydrothermalis]|uniref:hypothetical protein n=1 Tax=Serinicoccus hydrothermalis TaxID=1758689 RepID=UPI00082F2BB6|nr:hypothetical protein [Serinicoccus hydrothermalis]
MTTGQEHPLAQDYLERLHAETVRLRVDEGRELEAQIREHLTEALPDKPNDASVRQVLDRLGEPALLVDAAGGAPPGPGRRTEPVDQTSPAREIGALLALVAAAVLFWLPVINILLWVGGLILLILAQRWTLTEKVWGFLVLGLSVWFPILGAGMAFLVVEGPACTTDEAGASVCPGDERGLTTMDILLISAAVLWLAIYIWTIVRLARSAARPRQ